jgi:DNA-binding NtrC family response regulator
MPQKIIALQRSILVVDEDQNLRRSLALILKRAGYLVTTVKQGCEALEILQAGNFNMVILDISTPANRLTLLPEILRMYAHISVLVFAAQWSPETRKEIERLGVLDHLEKPVTPGQLLECVETILERKSGSIHKS